jgi:plasmid stabilization system protein ParE
MSNVRLYFSRKAKIEMADAWDWYEDEQKGLGARFENNVDEKIRLIIRNPFLYPIKGIHREANVDSFPFIIVYSFNETRNIVSILSVFHTSRNPKWKPR